MRKLSLMLALAVVFLGASAVKAYGQAYYSNDEAIRGVMAKAQKRIMLHAALQARGGQIASAHNAALLANNARLRSFGTQQRAWNNARILTGQQRTLHSRISGRPINWPYGIAPENYGAGIIRPVRRQFVPPGFYNRPQLRW